QCAFGNINSCGQIDQPHVYRTEGVWVFCRFSGPLGRLGFRGWPRFSHCWFSFGNHFLHRLVACIDGVAFAIDLDDGFIVGSEGDWRRVLLATCEAVGKLLAQLGGDSMTRLREGSAKFVTWAAARRDAVAGGALTF